MFSFIDPENYAPEDQDHVRELLEREAALDESIPRAIRDGMKDW